MKKIIFLLIVIFVNKVHGQLIINNGAPYNSSTYLIDNILLGGGIATNNHSYIGDTNQIGYFNTINSNLGIDSGIVLSSGSIYNLNGPNNDGSTSTSFFGAGDLTLDAVISPDLTNDAAVLEFDFIPNSDSISFKYVFGSEEYLEFVNSYNDAFGFFLSGPNPAGGNYIDENLAIIPGTSTPVTINNVNDIMNSSYYIDNGDGLTSPQNTDSTVIQFDGFTTPMKAVAAVNCGSTYHIKIVVADAVDDAWDSGVFLEAGSFSVSEPGSISIEVNTTEALCSGDSSGTASIYCVQGITPPYTINWDGEDPTTLFAGNYTVYITDANGVVSSQSYTINEPSDISQVLSYNSGILTSNTIGGSPIYIYSWIYNNNLVGNNMNHIPTQNGDYICIVTDANGCTDTSSVITIDDLVSSINEIYSALNISPNPFNNKTSIKLSTNSTIQKILLFNSTGYEIKNINYTITNNNITLNRENIKNGIYILYIQTDKHIIKEKLVIN